MAAASQAAGSAAESIVVWQAQPGPQTALISCPFEDVFFGGARGGGKTDGSLGDWLSHAEEAGKYARGIFFRRTYDELEEALDRATELFTPLGAVYKASKRVWIFPNGARLKFRRLERDRDASRYQGHQYTWVCFEELTHWASPEPVDKLRACLRNGKAPVAKRFLATGNPGGVGHNWVKARYIDPAPPFTPFYDVEQEVWRVFIPSRLDDNLALQQNDPGYWKRVKASANGNEALLQAWRWGNWDIVAGGMLDDLFRRGVHVIKPFRIPDSWRVDRSFDWGDSRPFSVGWWAESDGTAAILADGRQFIFPRGTLFRIGEWYGWKGKPNQGLKMLAPDIAKGIKKREAELAYVNAGRIKAGPADGAIFNAGSIENTKSIADVMAAEGVRWTQADKSPGSRKLGWQRLREYLSASAQQPMEKPGLFIFEGCTQWIRTVPVLPRDENDLDDVDSDAEDHAGDETRYRLLARRDSVGKMEFLI
jgi:Terminase large subunit, T4likevirus-type, N-terminal